MANNIVRTAPKCSSSDFCLLELNSDVETCLVSGESVSIIGAEEERAVLCTSNTSYSIVKESTSNARLLTPHNDWNTDKKTSNSVKIIIQSCTNFHYALERRPIDVAHLEALLMEAPLKGKSDGKQCKSGKQYCMKDLMMQLRASESEIRLQLTRLHAFENADHWMILEPSFEERVFDDILHAISQNDWDPFTVGISLRQLQSVVQESLIVLKQCVGIYGNQCGTLEIDQAFCLDKNKLAMFCAKQIFNEIASANFSNEPSSRPNKFVSIPLDQFMKKWKVRVPDQVHVDSLMLRGLAVIQTIKQQEYALYLPENTLPADPKSRFQALFAFQSKWTLTQLDPYIISLVSSDTSQPQLLLKYTRALRQANSGEKVYCKQ
uniref:Sister chromatid cohesion protein DCC1 putative n=1 Tax=Albugo laibachii Nc14 TaxID=890382 RepID=F0WQB9_9STRA|nr:sister chromatid cohesion protein DCC1 putative [Albugo laibachii Nc14]|eukprot:CCA23527.1 sister chromatid cohesion protein DCC1 putative [Albugo laibachii Nc14]